MGDMTANISLRGNYRDGLDPDHLAQLLDDVIQRESRVMKAGGFELTECKTVVNADPALDRRTGIEEATSHNGIEPTGQRRRCLYCHRPLGHGHVDECRFNGVVLTLQSGLYDD